MCTLDFLSSSASSSLFLFWCFIFGQIFKGSNQSFEGIQFVMLVYGVQVLCPGLELAPFCWNWHKNGTKELAFLQDL
jgi:hypothetical protein